MESEPVSNGPPAIDRGANLRRAGCWLLVGMTVGTIAALVYLRWSLADPTPALSLESFRQGQDLWREREVENYDIEIQVSGPQPATYRVEVRRGEAVAAYRNQRPLTQQRTFGTWSVPGMFSTMRRDLDQVERRLASPANINLPNLTLRAAFHPQFGYPERYLRMESGSMQDVSWQVTQFVPRDRP